jgi:hypothetical protein
MANNRIFYAVQALKIGSTFVKGVQSVGITTNFNLEQVFEMGQLGIYENIQNIPEVEVTAEKVIDGETLLYTAAGAANNQDIVGATSGVVDVRLAIYKDTGTSASGTTADYAVLCTGMRVSAISYTFPVEGNATESITLVGNSKTWDTTGGATFPPITGTLQTPANTVFRRQHYVAASSNIPSHIGNNKIQSISASADIGRENIFELGSFAPYTKYATFPVTTTCDIEVISIEGDQVSGNASTPVYSSDGDKQIKLTFSNTTKTLVVDLGTKNRLTSVNYTGADTGGGNATSTYSYQGFNFFQVSLT